MLLFGGLALVSLIVKEAMQNRQNHLQINLIPTNVK